MLLKRELHRNVHIGEQIEARVINVRKDGKMDLSLQKKAYLQMEDDAKKIYEIIEARVVNCHIQIRQNRKLLKMILI